MASTGQGILGSNMFAYCNNNPVNRIDDCGYFWDTVLDVVSLGFSVAEAIKNPNDPMAWLGVAADVASLAVPFVGGAGVLLDIATKTDDVVDVAKATNSFTDIGKAVENAGTVAKVHGNSLKTTKETIGYALRKNGTDEIMKYGETTRGLKRYTNKFYRENDVYMDIMKKGSKLEMHTWQHEMIVGYYKANGKLPPMNKSFW